MTGTKRAAACACTLLLSIMVIVASYASQHDNRARTRTDRVLPEPVIHTDGLSRDMAPKDENRLFRGPAAAPETTVIGAWDFDGPGGVCDAQGWVSVDFSVQGGVYWHVDDFVGLGGGDFGRLLPLEGNKSMWLGLRDIPELACEYATLPGYGDRWAQTFFTVDCLSVTGDVTIDFLQTYDCELAYDFVYVQYDECDDNWATLGTYDGIGSGFYSHTVPAAAHNGSVRFRFFFQSDWAWSDADGDPNTDGATIIDSLTVMDTLGVVLPTELFEVEAVGDTTTLSGSWAAAAQPDYGDFDGLFSGLDVVQEDPCNRNVSCLWGFFNGSTYDYACGGFPAQATVPYIILAGPNTRQLWLENEIWSPVVPITGTGSEFVIEFDVYKDVPLDPLILYVWHVRTWDAGQCRGAWRDHDFWYYGDLKKWETDRQNFNVFESANDSIQVAVGVEDMCWAWCGIYGNGYCHTHAPLFDNVRVIRVDSNGPNWEVQSRHLFQDNFATDGTITGTVRADMAQDILQSYSPTIRPGDSVTVFLRDLESGLGFDIPGDTTSGPAVYCFVSVDGPNAATTGSSLLDDPRYYAIGTQMVGGHTWTKIQMDSSRTSTGTLVGDTYNIDLHDALFVPGDTVWYFFGASGGLPDSETNYWSEFTGTVDDIAAAAASAMEFTCLPAAGWRRGGDILYVDGADGSGAQLAFEAALHVLGLDSFTDRYDERAPDVKPDNGLASRVMNVQNQILACYGRIIWSTGAMFNGPGDSNQDRTKSDDFGLLYTFINNLEAPGGLYFNGDRFVWHWDYNLSGTSSSNFRNKFMNFAYCCRLDGDHHLINEISPLVIGEPGSFFVDGVPDTIVAFGGCPEVRNFDVVNAAGLSAQEMSYYSQASGSGAIVSQRTANTTGDTVGVVLSGFGFDAVRDDRSAEFPDAVIHLDRILGWLGSRIGTGVGDEPPVYRNTLAQNRPNPFNPVTTISYSVKESARVTLRIYSVSGQLVRTLVDDVKDPGITHEVTWDGANNAGTQVSSGVYFYRLTAPGFTRTKKMVLLK